MQQEHFTLIKEQRLENNITQESVDQVVEKVEAYFGRLQVHLVIGGNNFAANEKFITDTIKSGRHFNEDSSFLSFLYKELKSDQNDGEKERTGRRRRKSSSSSSDDSRSKSRRSKKKKKKERKRSLERRLSGERSTKSERRREAFRQSLPSDPSRRTRRRSYSVGGRDQRSQTGSDQDDIIVLESPSPSPSPPPSPVPGASDPQEQLKKKMKGEEEEALRQLRAERDFYSKHPNKHPKYAEMWAAFWRKKNKELEARGININTVNIEPEWLTVFDKFIITENKEKTESKKSELALKRRQSSRCEIIMLSGESDSERQLSPPPPPRISDPRRRRRSEYEEELKVLTLLNFLSQLSSKHLFSAAICDKVSQIRKAAFSMEADVYGSSQLLLHNKDCFNLMDQAEEALKLKHRERKVGELDLSVVNITLAQISVFLRTSSCQKSDILEIETISPTEKDNSRVLKMSISKTIERELKNSGKIVSKQELESLVEAEFARVKYKIPNTTANLRNINLQSSSSTSDQSNLFSAYSDSIDWANVMKGVNTVQKSRDPRVQLRPAGNSQAKPTAKSGQSSENLTDGELAALMANFDQLRQEEKNKLIACLGELEALDPRKVERIKRIIFRNK